MSEKMTGPEHYREAEALIAQSGSQMDKDIVEWMVARAQVHATLALAAAVIETGAVVGPYHIDMEWARTVWPQVEE